MQARVRSKVKLELCVAFLVVTLKSSKEEDRKNIIGSDGYIYIYELRRNNLHHLNGLNSELRRNL